MAGALTASGMDEEVTNGSEEKAHPIEYETLVAFAKYLGQTNYVDPQLLWVAEAALSAPCPHPWKEFADDEGFVYYYNEETDVSTREHPLDRQFRALYLRKQDELSDSSQGSRKSWSSHESFSDAYLAKTDHGGKSYPSRFSSSSKSSLHDGKDLPTTMNSPRDGSVSSGKGFLKDLKDRLSVSLRPGSSKGRTMFVRPRSHAAAKYSLRDRSFKEGGPLKKEPLPQPIQTVATINPITRNVVL
mmetsp:Transcript_18843/g.30926  ORF Transcript_18843/g.30926 Transcript_18843/m.30926 type:complete len:244 (-) Transcript_18843:381-1112(-)|eukprot:CAMPEP_0184667646 /NCGR_PEP_ID=MMETSP0308-20130426/68454_1 /TAXON_ID=38269 /ORGANISM="Gloeochaete witrockiana, Strain SAG 46.84" /LENGTH=243 /DNA_ID=CAMNT_0027112967 /DNA_START=141 /DNA_END=872 /DNA_ORIENTATION=+